jgi:glycosyltransferase involved in cell wall biosynthesis
MKDHDLKKKIAFFKIGRFSHTNESVELLLRKEFPDYDLQVIHVWKDIVMRDLPINIIFTIKEFGLKVLWDNLGISLIRTEYLYNKVKKRLNAALSGNDYAFTIQTQSLFDMSLEGVPHFVYTDNTHLANLKYIQHDKKGLALFILKSLMKAISKRDKSYLGAVTGYITSSIIMDYCHNPAKVNLERTIFANATLVFTWSSNVSRSVIEEYGIDQNKVVCIYAGSNSKMDYDLEPSIIRYEAGNILFVGKNWELKGGPELAEAFKALSKDYPDATLTIIGCSPTLKHPNIDVKGYLPLDEVGKYYERASIFCLPTRVEAFGIVFIEAFLNSLPVIATNIAAIPDFVHPDENGYLVDLQSSRQIEAALRELLDDPEKCMRYGRNGFMMAKEKYTWESTGRRMKEHIIKNT